LKEMIMKKLLLTGLIAAAIASPALAHTHLKSAVPAEGSTVASAPTEFVLTFSEATRLTALSIQKDGGAQQKISALPTAAAAQTRIPAPKLDDGRYTLNWRVVGSDGHVVDGKIVFTVGGKATPGTASKDTSLGDRAHSH
jgi:methionine-rich copper-binding protein CopC